MANYHATYDRDSGTWSAKREGASRAAERTRTQAEAQQASQGYAERSGGGDVFTHRKDNARIRERNTYGKADPYPPEG